MCVRRHYNIYQSIDKESTDNDKEIKPFHQNFTKKKSSSPWQSQWRRMKSHFRSHIHQHRHELQTVYKEGDAGWNDCLRKKRIVWLEGKSSHKNSIIVTVPQGRGMVTWADMDECWWNITITLTFTPSTIHHSPTISSSLFQPSLNTLWLGAISR